jgi:hypothetical protein
MSEYAIYPEDPTPKNTAEIIDLYESRRRRALRQKFGHDVMTIDAVATETLAGFNVEEVADKVRTDAMASSHSETAADIATAVELTGPEDAATKEFDDEVQEVTADAVEHIENTGVEVNETDVETIAKERLVTAAIESSGETDQDRDELTTDEREREAAQAVAAQVLAEQIEDDAAPLITKQTKDELRAQLLDKDPDKLDNHHLAEIGADAVEESKGDGEVESYTVYDEDGNATEITHNTDTARRVALALRGKFDEAAQGIDHVGRDNIWQRLDYLKENHGNDISKTRLTPIEYKRLERTIARELEFSGVTMTDYRDAA